MGSKGYTLLEVLVVVVMIGLVANLIVAPVIFSYKNYIMQKDKLTVINDARVAMDYMTRDIREYQDIEVDDGKYKIGGEDYELRGRTMYKGEKKVFSGVDGIDITNTHGDVEITVKIKMKDEEDYVIKSKITLR